jgi:hypothetical protein
VGAALSGSARADELKFDFSGKIQSDLRFRLQDESVGSYFNKVEVAPGLERNQNLLSVKMKAVYGRFSGVAAADMYLNITGQKVQAFGDLQNYSAVQPFSFEPQQVYIQSKGLILKGLDLTIGNQIIAWGVADQFNPTNNLNSDDVRDTLLFGKQQANFMVKADYWVTKSFSMSAVLVPLFKPALLPATGVLGTADIQRMPFTGDAIRHRIESEFGFAASAAYPTVIHTLTPVLPQASADNMQFAFRLAGTLGEQDIALSYYLGRTDFPQPFSNHTTEVDGVRCDPANPTKCIKGTLSTDTLLGYPRMHVYGFNMSGEFNPFKKISETINGIGYRLEAALIVPQRTTLQLTQGDLSKAVPFPAGEYDYQGVPGQLIRGGNPPPVVESTPFAKWTVGLDYTFGEHVYINAQWVHGLVDEFGAGDFIHQGWQVRESGISTTSIQTFGQCVSPKDGTTCATETLLPKLGDYFVLGADFKFLQQAGLFRVFTIWDLSGVTFSSYDPTATDPTTGMMGTRVMKHYGLFTKEGFSAVLYPELDYNFGNGLELGAGGLFLFGRTYTKFGDPAAGGSVLFTRGRFSF